MTTEANPLEPQPTLKTERLRLRPFQDEDADAVERLASEKEIAANTLNIPYPYPKGGGGDWIRETGAARKEGRLVNFALVTADDQVIGCVTLKTYFAHRRAELGFWIGKPFWGKGYASEAVARVLAYGFHDLGLNRIFATHFLDNIASGKIMLKNGMKYEGRLRQHVLKWEVFKDLEMYSILAEEFETE